MAFNKFGPTSSRLAAEGKFGNPADTERGERATSRTFTVNA